MSENKALHILAFNIPYPANYGGAIDVFHKIVALKKAGVEVHLHCFEYGRKQANILENYCKSVHYYKRKSGLRHVLSNTPYFVQTRSNQSLVEYLTAHPYPILSEGIHCSKNVLIPLLKNRKKYLRAHNVETDYYLELSKSEPNFWKRLYFFTEYLKLKQYEKKVALFDGVFAISMSDHAYFKNRCQSNYIKAFHSNTEILSKLGMGTFALYHGNLSLQENIKAALFLIKKVFAFTDYPFIIAGKRPCPTVLEAVKKYSHIKLIQNPSAQHMNELIAEAHMCLLPTHQKTGIKLKLIESLHRGRFCVANHAMINNTELAPYCYAANSANEWLKIINTLKHKDFNSELLIQRKQISTVYNNDREALKLIEIIFEKK